MITSHGFPDEISITRAEYEALMSLRDGYSNAEAASRLGVTTGTFKGRLRTLYQKLGSANVLDTLTRAWKYGILRSCPTCHRPRQGTDGQEDMFPEGVAKRYFRLSQGPDTDSAGDLVRFPEKSARGADGSPLTPRQTQIVLLLAAGLNLPQTAEALHLAPDTLRTHRNNIFRTLNVHNQTEAVLCCLLNGYITRQRVLEYRQKYRRGTR